MTDSLAFVVVALVSLAAGGAAAWLAARRRGDAPEGDARERFVDDLRAQLAEAKSAAATLLAEKTAALREATAAETALAAARAELERERALHAEELARRRDEARDAIAALDARHAADLVTLRDSFSRLGGEVLRGMAPDVTKEVAAKVEPLVQQMGAALAAYQATLQTGMQGQQDAISAVRERMDALGKTAEALTTSTQDFTRVLGSSQHRGRWGEQTLRRVVEVAGMSPHCDFVEQATLGDSRPDLLVKLPGRRVVVVDAKVPELDVASLDASAPNRADLLAAHAQKLKKTIRDLAARRYPETMSVGGDVAFEKVVLFLPAESLLGTALEGDPELLVEAGRLGVLLATPATLIALLGAIHLCWREHAQAENAREIAAAAAELYKRVATFAEHLAQARKSINAGIGSLNQAFGSFERLVRPKGEELVRLGVQAAKDLPADLDDVDELRDLRRREG